MAAAKHTRPLRRQGTGSAATEKTGSWKPSSWISYGALLLITVVAYLPALRAGFIWDDDDYVTHNLALRTWQGLRDIWTKPGTTPQYYPLVHTTFWLEYQLWQLRPAGYHAVNILLHGLNACLAWALLRKLSLPGAWVAAALFAIHPVHVESVAWITERKNVLSGLFYLISGLSCVRVWSLSRENQSAPEGSIAWKWYAIAIFTFLAALLSKTVTCTLPAAVLLVVWWKRGRITRTDWLLSLPFFILGALLAAVTVWMEKTVVGAKGFDWDLSFAQRVLIAGRAVWFYATKLVLPANLTFIYPKWDVNTGVVWQWLFPAAFFATVIALLFLRKRLGRGPLTAVLFFAGTLFPALGFFDIYPMRYSYVADHFQYLASLGLLALTGPLYKWMHQRTGDHTFLWIGGAILASLGYLTWMQCGVYKNLETLWSDTLRKNPRAGMAHVNLGNLLAQRGEIQKAHQHYKAALAVDPRDDYAHYNAGVAYYQQGNIDSAVLHYLEALRIRPDYVEAHFNLGKALEAEGELEDAMESYEEVLKINPHLPDPRISLALLLVATGKTQEAEAHYRTVLAAAPDHPLALFNYATLLITLNRQAEAAVLLRRLVQLNPQDLEARQLLQSAEELEQGPAATTAP